MASLQIDLPFPISVNAIWRGNSKHSVYRIPKYIKWLKEAESQWLLQRPSKSPKRIEGRYTLDITLCRPDKRRRDLGNYEKVISDFLHLVGIIDDDNLSEKITLQWGTAEVAPLGARVTVTHY